MMNMMTASESLANSVDADLGASPANGYFRIGEVARMHDVTLRALRFYEDKGLLNPKRDGATRLYDRRDVARLKLILMGRRVGFSLREVKHMMDLYDPKGSNARQLRVTLEKSEKQYDRLQKQRVAIDHAMAELGRGIDAVKASLRAGHTQSAA